jgi:hypothetical protein
MFQSRLVIDCHNDYVLGLILHPGHLVPDIVVPIFGGVQPPHPVCHFQSPAYKDHQNHTAEEFSMHCYRQYWS